MTREPPSSTDALKADIQSATIWIIALSISLMVLGILAILMPRIASALFTAAIGWIALGGGLIQLIQAWQAKVVWGLWLSFGAGIFYTIAGLYLLLNPLKAAAILALVFGLLLIVEGIFTITMAFVYRVGGRMSWFVAINGIITLILGILAINRWPINARWLIGLYLGISLLLSGASLLGSALAARQDAA
ncbi:DUF308 domain-containing protein [Nodosilinea sp. LEGE 07088]|uniref:HdeD family acid-resistance protein n=1 Tax=Nodosilinea sp. LEGE 07088 TaxID=2777968 RepID=UPI00187FF822|nr:DUF308 domain-containing protein [Nodosilinea sp. LEGE 07088]MBE9141092.1 DUF308 domain-containing protein [Nodosilinea sp. LEGE 07088]